MSTSTFILVAEDDEDDQELIKLAFAAVGGDYTFKVVSDGQQLLDYLSSHPGLPCLIILDLNMPVLNGFQTLMALQGDPRLQVVPKVVLTTSENDDNKKKSILSGARDYFVKPSTMKEFVAAAQKMLTYCQ